ncbi:hypothetical protein TRVA0_039S01486 [Trichomonascus vanleenenianus]|uniref:uncharacterized protein n=1 Tax=Trichomonascus vanleenenianus TaxID=2268995 RepID=UPI003ECA38F9
MMSFTAITTVGEFLRKNIKTPEFFFLRRNTYSTTHTKKTRHTVKKIALVNFNAFTSKVTSEVASIVDTFRYQEIDDTPSLEGYEVNTEREAVSVLYEKVVVPRLKMIEAKVRSIDNRYFLGCSQERSLVNRRLFPDMSFNIRIRDDSGTNGDAHTTPAHSRTYLPVEFKKPGFLKLYESRMKKALVGDETVDIRVKGNLRAAISQLEKYARICHTPYAILSDGSSTLLINFTSMV